MAAITTKAAVKTAVRVGSKLLQALGNKASGKENKAGCFGVLGAGVIASVLLAFIIPVIIFMSVPQAMASVLVLGDDGKGTEAYQIGLDEITYYQKVEADFKARMVSFYGDDHTVLNQPNWRYFAVVDALLYQNDPDKAKALRASTDKWLFDELKVSTETRQESHEVTVKDKKTGVETTSTVTEDVVWTIVTYPELKELLKGKRIVWEIIPGEQIVLDDDFIEMLIDANWTVLMSYTGDLNLGPGLSNFLIAPDALSDPVFARLMSEATKYIGYPYVYGGSSPSTSFDCSGFVCWVYTQSGVHNIPRTTAQGIYMKCGPVTYDKLKPGDLVFFHSTYDFYETITHIGIYVGNDTMLHCGDPIGFANLKDPYWQEHWYSGGRLV